MREQMVTLFEIDTFLIGGKKIKVQKKIRQYYEFEKVFVVRLDESDGTVDFLPVLLGIGYFSNDFKTIWEFPYNDVVGICPLIVEKMKPENFVSTEHYQKYLEQYNGKELLEVYSGDFRYVLDANTGEIYEKTESR